MVDRHPRCEPNAGRRCGVVTSVNRDRTEIPMPEWSLATTMIARYVMQFGGIALIVAPIVIGAWWFAAFWRGGGPQP